MASTNSDFETTKYRRRFAESGCFTKKIIWQALPVRRESSGHQDVEDSALKENYDESQILIQQEEKIIGKR